MTRKTPKNYPSLSGEPETTGSNTRGYIFVGVFVGVIILGAAFLLLNNNQQPAPSAPANTGTSIAGVQTFPILSRDHVEPGQTHPAYNSNPPTNGWHFPQWADWGIYVDTIPDEYLVHNLEHGGIWISYRDSENSDIVNQLIMLVSNDSDRVILTHRPLNDSPIAVAAWGALLELDQVDANAIRAFIQEYRYHGPENVP